ncbi:MAG: RNA polymerase sigma factor [Lachnospiraceae bacterium]
MDDSKIIMLYNNRQELAIVETKKKYNSYLLCIANNILHNPLDNEECVNDTYLKTWNSIPPAQPNSFKAFIGKIARNDALNKLRDLYRDKRKILCIAENFDELENMFSSNNIEEKIENNHIEEILNNFLKDLSLKKRVIFVRRYWYFDSIKDISERTNLSESNVKIILKRERDSLKKILVREGVL